MTGVRHDVQRGAVAGEETTPTTLVRFFGSTPAGIDPRGFSARIEGSFVPDADGPHEFGIVTTGFNIGGTVGPILYGSLMDHGQPLLVFAASVFFIVATMAMALVGERRAKRPVAAAE